MLTVVRWGSALSRSVPLVAGVRQGSVLAPALFSFFVNDILVKLARSGTGCHIKNFCVNAIMYADDLLLLSLSLDDMQSMINLCNKEFISCGLALNAKKSVLIRVGPRHAVKFLDINVNGQRIPCPSELKFLGVSFLLGPSFACNLQVNKQKFFQASNSILGRVGGQNFNRLTLSVIDKFCITNLLYGLEALNHR